MAASSRNRWAACSGISIIAVKWACWSGMDRCRRVRCNIRLNGQRNRILTGRRLSASVGLRREGSKSAITSHDNCCRAERSAHGSLVQNIFVRSIDQPMATTHASTCRCLDLYALRPSLPWILPVRPRPCGVLHDFPRGSVVVQGSMLDSLDHFEGRRGQELTLVVFGWLIVFASTSLSVARFHPPRLTYPAPKATLGKAQSEGPPLQPKHPLR